MLSGNPKSFAPKEGSHRRLWAVQDPIAKLFPAGNNLYGSHQFLNWWQQMSTGHLHLDGFEPHIATKKKNHTIRCGFFFGGRYRTRTYDLPHVKRML